jgi:hypothetical protein
MIDELNKRVIEVMVRSDLSKSTFASVLDVSLPLITHITSGRNKPGLDIIQKLLTHFKDISPDWLLLGAGEMYRAQPKQKDFSLLIAKLNTITEEIGMIKKSQQSVIQYNKILLDEVKHLVEIDNLIEQDGNKIDELLQKIDAIKTELLSN